MGVNHRLNFEGGDIFTATTQRLLLAIDKIEIAILAVPGESAQDLIDSLVESGVRGILNYAPITPKVSNHIQIQTIDPVHALQSMTFYLAENRIHQ